MRRRYVHSLLIISCFRNRVLTTYQMVRLTIRATDESVPPVLMRLMEDWLSQGISTVADEPDPLSRREISDVFKNVLVT